MSKTYKYSGLTPELYQRLVSEHTALRQAHKKGAYKQFFKMSNNAMNCKRASFTKRLIVQSWNVRGYRPKLSTD